MFIITPINPVVSGHRLVIPTDHIEDATADTRQTGRVFAYAADYARRHRIEANLITSIGEAATQTIKHLHVHVVPRREGDGVVLPWSNQESPRVGELTSVLADVDEFFHTYGRPSGDVDLSNMVLVTKVRETLAGNPGLEIRETERGH
jgi:histidine triad (HIT) family protein